MSDEKIIYLKNGVIVREAKREDMSAVASMIQELADFEKMPDGPKINKSDLERDGFESSPPAFRCLIAEVSRSEGEGGDVTEPVGYALYFPTYSTWEGRSCQLEDLYVKPAHRGRGLGGMLFDSVSKMAVSLGSGRLDLHVLSWNPAAEWYSRRGVRDLTEAEGWRYWRLTPPALHRAAHTHQPTM